MHFSTLVIAFGATNLSWPRYHVLMDTFCPLCGPVMCGGIWIFTDDMLTILLPVSQEVNLLFTTYFSPSTWITSPYLLKMSLSLSLFISMGTSYTITLVIAERESSWMFTLLPKILSPSTKKWFWQFHFSTQDALSLAISVDIAVIPVRHSHWLMQSLSDGFLLPDLIFLRFSMLNFWYHSFLT